MFKLGNRTVFWRHTIARTPWVLEGTKNIMVDAMTECIIQDDKKHTLAVGVSHKHIADSHNRSIGRKYSLERALKHLTKDMKPPAARALRKHYWEKYLNG